MKYLRGRRWKATAAVVASLGLLASACGGGGSGSGGESSNPKSQPIDIGYINWNEDIALTYLWQHLLTERGYKVNVNQLDAAAIFKGMTTGDVDVFFDTWLPNTHKPYWKRFGDKLTKLTKWYDTAPLALAVPKYTYDKGVKSIADLKNKASLFDGKITGIGPSAGETRVIQEDVMPAYSLKDSMQYVTSSSTAMLSALDDAVKNKKDIVVALWYPHWAWKEYDVKQLKDPKNAFGKPDSIYTTARGEESSGGAFKEDYPKVGKWMSNMHLKPDQIASMSNAIVNNADSEQARKDAAAKWAEEHQDIVKKWIPESSGS